jgi:hypothetical protein
MSFPWAPIAVLSSLILSLLATLVPQIALLAACVPLLLLLATDRFRPLLAACFLGNLLMVFGSVGEVEFLGYLTISAFTPVVALTFSNVLSLTVFFMSKFGSRIPRQPVQRIPQQLHVVILVVSMALLLVRFTSGIPILQGDASRLSGLLTVNPYLGLLSGIVPIAAAFLNSGKSRLLTALKIAVLLLVVGTASRLLLAAVLVGLVTSSALVTEKQTRRTYVYVIGTALLTVLAITKIYTARTAEGIQQAYEYRIGNVGGIVGFISDIVGPSIFYAARNGLVVNEILMNDDARPPGGFIGGSLLHAINLGQNPELWLTSVLGFDAESVGAIATPIWSGAVADFGLGGGVLAAAVMGLALTLALRFVPSLQYWFAFGVLLSFYGSYLVSSQFLAASLLIAIIAVLSDSTTRNGVPHPSKHEVTL